MQIAMFAIAVAISALTAVSLLGYFMPTADRIRAGRRADYRAREAMLNEETGLRAFAITHEDAYLEPFHRGAAQLAQANADLQSTIGTDPGLASLLLDTRLAEERWTERWTLDAQRADASHDGEFLERGRTLFDAYRARESALDAAIDARVARNDETMRLVRGALALLLIVLVGAVVVVARYERRVRDRHERRLLVLLRAAHEIAQSLDEAHIVRVLERACGELTRTSEPKVVLAGADEAPDGLARRAIESGKPTFDSSERGKTTTMAAAVPMVVGGRVIGALVTESSVRPRSADAHKLELLAALANFGAAAIESSRLYRQAHEQSRVDALTHVFNRRRLDEDLADECRRSARYVRPLSLVMVDVDHFKAYNDANGHAAGDKALQEVAALLRAGVRLIDSVYRFGGEELAILLRETDIRGASVVAERLRATIEAAGKVTASFGVAELDAKRPVAGSLIDAADRALYAAKHTGRNRISLAHDDAAAAQLDA